MNGQKDHTEYSQFIILVCNIPDEEYASTQEKAIINGIKHKWKRDQNDPEGERIHIIYMHPDDPSDSEKFKPLKLADNLSKIYITGHCKAGADVIQSDAGIYNENYPGYDAENEQVGFGSRHITNILAENLSKQTMENPQSLNRRLRICVPSCHSGVNQRKDNGEVEKAFSYKLAEKLFENGVKCDVVGYRGYVVPVPSEPDIYDFVNFMQEKEISQPGFHKRHFLVEGHKLFTSIPSHQPNVNYKQEYIISPKTTEEDIQNNEVKIAILPANKANERLKLQTEAQGALDLSDKIIKERPGLIDEDDVKYAKGIKTAILEGWLSKEEIVEANEGLIAITEGLELKKANSIFPD